MQQLNVALSYNSIGWPVFPCRSSAEEVIDPATGEVTSLGEKTPRTSNGFKSATKFKHILERWWRDWPDSAIGIPTGSATGIFVLDIDRKPGGADGYQWLEEMEKEHGPFPKTARVKSPNGGLHIYFKYVAGTRNRGALGAGVDIRSEGGYVLAAGSQMANGRSYEWEECQGELPPVVADAPEWLLELLLPKPQSLNHEYKPSHAGNAPYVNAAVEGELRSLADAPMGTRNNSLNDAAFNLGTLVGAKALDEAEARSLLQDIARGWGRDWSRCVKTIENGLAAGIRSPRSIPEQRESQDNTRLIDITKMIESGLRKAKEKSIIKPTEGALEPYPNNETASRAPSGEEQGGPAFVATPFKWKDPRKLPRREFAFGTHYIRKYVSVTVAPGGLGKTANSIVEALAMVSGKPLTGTKPAERLRVQIFNSEDPRDELDRRIMAACIRYKLTPDDVQGLFLDTGREQELVIAVEDKKTGVRIVQPIVEAVVEQIQKHKIDVMIVDPFVSTHQVNENDNGAIDKVAKLWAQIADHTNCAIDIVHHLRKLADREATVEDARGAVSLIGAARSVRILNRMSANQAKDAGLSEQDRYGYFSINHGKANLTAMSSKLDWRRLDGVPLGNGRGLTKPQDFAPVVVEWQWPSMEKQLEAVPEDALTAIKKRIGGGDYWVSEQSKTNWAGIIVADVLKVDLDDKAGKARVVRMLKHWQKEGHLTTELRMDERRKQRSAYAPVWDEAA